MVGPGGAEAGIATGDGIGIVVDWILGDDTGEKDSAGGIDIFE